MKLLVVLVAMVACTKGWDLKCGLDRFSFKGSADEFPGWPAEDMRIGMCNMSEGYALQGTYMDCGVKVATDGDDLLVDVMLLSNPIKTIITRKKPVEYMLGCTFNMKTLSSATTGVQPIVGQLGGLVSKTGKAIEFTLSYTSNDAENMVSNGEPLKVPVGTDLTVEVSGPHLEEFGVYATISDCFATPSADPNDATYYPLVSKMCIYDPDVTVTRVGRKHILKFKSFAFTQHSTSMTYLHCDVFACTSPKSCGRCVKDWRTISSAWMKQWNDRVRVAMVFEPNTYETLDIANLRCKPNGFRFQATQEDFPLWNPKDIMIGTCPLDSDFSLAVTYDQCGFEMKERRHQLLMQTYITGKSTSDEVIQRRRPIRYMLRCGYDRFARVSTGSALGAIMPEPLVVGTFTSRPDMFLNLLDDRGYKLERTTLEVSLNQKVEAIIGGKDVESLKMRLYAVNCFVTPTADASGSIQHNLLRDSCPTDATFQSETFGSGQKISFDSFAFTHDHTAQLYLHCDVTACMLHANCGACSNQEENEPRKKRAAHLSWNQRLDASGRIHVNAA